MIKVCAIKYILYWKRNDNVAFSLNTIVAFCSTIELFQLLWWSTWSTLKVYLVFRQYFITKIKSDISLFPLTAASILADLSFSPARRAAFFSSSSRDILFIPTESRTLDASVGPFDRLTGYPRICSVISPSASVNQTY